MPAATRSSWIVWELIRSASLPVTFSLGLAGIVGACRRLVTGRLESFRWSGVLQNLFQRLAEVMANDLVCESRADVLPRARDGLAGDTDEQTITGAGLFQSLGN